MLYIKYNKKRKTAFQVRKKDLKMKVKAKKTMNENIAEGKTYTIKETKNGILLLYYNDNKYYLLNRKQLEESFIIL